MGFILKNVTAVNCGTGISAPKSAFVSVDGFRAINCQTGIEITDSVALEDLVHRIRALEISDSEKEGLVGSLRGVVQAAPGHDRITAYERFVSFAADHVSLLGPAMMALVAFVNGQSA